MAKTTILTAIDIGTQSLKGLCAKKDVNSEEIEILAQLQIPVFGVRNGEVVKTEPVAKAVLEAKTELSQQAGIKIKGAVTNISGPHLFSVFSQGLVSVSRADQNISREDIQRVLKAAQAVNLPSNKEILEVVPKEFIVDGEEGVKEPLGLRGIRLEAKVLLLCVFSPILENLEKVFQTADLQILDVVPSPVAAAKAVLEPEQKELGALVIDIGSGTTSAAVFEKGELLDFVIFPIGSAKITDDIAIGLRTEIQTAEQIKKEFAVLLEGSRKSSRSKKASRAQIELADKSLVFPRKFLNEIVKYRFEQIFGEIQKCLKKISSGQPLPAGVFLTGGGVLTAGVVEFAKQRLKLPVRVGYPKGFMELNDPQFAVCAGLLMSGFEGVGQIGEKTRGESLAEKFKRFFRIFLP